MQTGHFFDSDRPVSEMVLISKCHGKWFLAKYPEVAKFGAVEAAQEAQEEETTNQSVIPMPESQTEKKTA